MMWLIIIKLVVATGKHQSYHGDMRVGRNLIHQLQAALADTRVVFLNGARQCGKSFFAQQAIEMGYRASYITLDDLATLSAAQRDPAGFIAGLERPVVIDEVQRVPELFLPIKLTVDRDPSPGQFLLTGSAHVMTLPRLADSLAGRMEILRVRPFSQGELEGGHEVFIDNLFAEASIPPGASPCNDVFDRIEKGGYPEAHERSDADRRSAWFRSYINAVTERDIRELANLERLAEVPRILQIFAAYGGGLVNYTQLSRDLGMPATTLKRYLTLLQTIFLLEELPAYAKSRVKRLIKAPKVFLTDSGLLAYLLDPGNLQQGRNRGAAIETFVLQELRKQASYSRTKPDFYHFRTASNIEVDFVLESGADVVGIEVKSSASVGPNDFKGLHELKNEVQSRFRRGVVLYLGEDTVPFARDLHAVPVSKLWTTAVAAAPPKTFAA